MTLVNIDLRNAGYETGPDDRVVFYSPVNRNEQGMMISTAETTVPLVDGQASKELAPGPVVVQILAQGVADTRPKSGYVPEGGPVSLWDVVLDWTPALVDQGVLSILAALDNALPSIEGARDEALGQVDASVDAAIGGRLDDKADREELAAIAPVQAREEPDTEWAHITTRGERLPLGYTPDGRLDAHARTIWREDVARLYATGQDSPYEYVVSTDTGHIIIGVLPDGTTVIPGLSATSTPSTPSTSTPVWVLEKLAAIAPVQAYGEPDTEWAHATEDGLRLPLGYTPDGRLDAHARTIWREDVARLYATGQDSPYEYVVSTDTGHIIIGVLPDGTTVIPGLSATSTPSTSTSAWVSGQGVVTPTTDMRRASGWGSSTMNEGSIAFSEMFAGLGVTYTNGGKGSELGDQTAARHGSQPALATFPGNTIPSSGDVDFTVSNVTTSQYLDPYEATVGGVLGMISSTATEWTFTRTEAGDPVTVEADTPVIPTLGAKMSDAVQLLNLGKNSFAWSRPNSPELVNGYTDNAVEWLKPQFKNVLVIGHFNNTERAPDNPVTAQIKEVNDYQRAKYGPLFVDLHTFVTTDLFWEYTGLTPTADDLAEQALGNKPHSGSRDHAHLDATGQKAFAAFVRDHMLALGWY